MYPSSKWPCIFLLLHIVSDCFGKKAEVNKTRPAPRDQPENQSFVVSVCLTVNERSQFSSGVLISTKRVLTACRPFVNVTSTDGKVTLSSIDHLKVWADHSQENGQWRSVVKAHCVDPSVATSTIAMNDVAVLDTEEEFKLSESFQALTVSEIMKQEELILAVKFRTECDVVTWFVKFKAKHVPDLENSYLKECPVETTNMSTCASFLSAEVAETSSSTLISGKLRCVIPEKATNRSCVAQVLPGSPVICSKKVLGLVSFTKEPALVDTFPVILTLINLKSFIAFTSLGRTIASNWYSPSVAVVLNTFLLQ